MLGIFMGVAATCVAGMASGRQLLVMVVLRFALRLEGSGF